MANKLYSENAVQNIADAIRAKNGLTTSYKISEMAQAITDLPSGGGLELITQEQRNSLTTVSGNYSNIGTYAFYSCTALTEANFPVCTTIGISAFTLCSSLTSVSFPQCTSIGYGAFQYCSSLTLASFPVCITISNNAFTYCRSLTSVNFPVCTTIGLSAFQSCSSLTSISFPQCTSISGYAFFGCSSLTSVNFPTCTTISSDAFYSCSSLAEATFPMCITLSGAYIFCRCSSLSKLTIGTSNCILSNINTFSSTPMSLSSYLGYFGSIYVPSEYLSQYKSATNWSRYSARLVGY